MNDQTRPDQSQRHTRSLRNVRLLISPQKYAISGQLPPVQSLLLCLTIAHLIVLLCSFQFHHLLSLQTNREHARRDSRHAMRLPVAVWDLRLETPRSLIPAPPSKSRAHALPLPLQPSSLDTTSLMITPVYMGTYLYLPVL